MAANSEAPKGQSKGKLLLLGEIEHEKSRQAWRKLHTELGYELLDTNAKTPEEFIEECKGERFEGVKAVYSTFVCSKTIGRLEGESVSLLAQRGVRFVCHCGAGYDTISVPSCTSSGVLVSNTPGAVDASTADTALFLLLGCLRNFNPTLLSLRQGTFRGKPTPALGHDPGGKTLAILGLGGIGGNLAIKAGALGMKTIYHNRHQLSSSQEKAYNNAIYIPDLNTFLSQASILSVHIPLTPSTRHFLSHERLQLLPRGAIIINTARGPIIDEAALVTLLDSDHIAAAGLDVYEEEPKVHPGLMRNENCVLLPHMGTYTHETQEAMELLTIENIRSAVEGSGLVTMVPESRAANEGGGKSG